LAAHYKTHGLKMLSEHATHDAGGIGIEAGITEMLERMQTGRLKVFRGQDQWMEEFRYYRREDGLIVKERDDLISSTRYALMMRRFAKQPPSVERWKPKPQYSGWGGVISGISVPKCVTQHWLCLEFANPNRGTSPGARP